MSRMLAAVAAIGVMAATAGAEAAPVYVGSFNVFDGPVWTANPTAMSAKQAAALIFGGSADDYVISVNASLDPGTITGTAWVDGYGNTQYLVTAVDDDFYQSSVAGGGYNSYPSFSAYVCDHANCAAYGYAVSSGYSYLNYTNYVWRAEAVPAPGSLAVFGLGLLGFVGLRRGMARA